MAGIPDLRPPALAGFDVARDRALALELAALGDAGLETLLRRYWRDHPEVPEPRAERFVRGDLVGADRAAEVVSQIEALAGGAVLDGATVLEVGAGSAALASVVAARAAAVVATDVSLAWLVIAARRLRDVGGRPVTLVASVADRLPFAEATFDAVVAADVIEHVPDARAMVGESARVLRHGGVLWVSTPNRLSLTPEPHVGLFGVGWLPRPIARSYVQRRRGIDYSDIRTLSAWRLRRLLASMGGTVRVTPPAIPTAVQAGYGPAAQRVIRSYNAARAVALPRNLLLAVAPLLHGMAVKGASR